MRRILIAEDSPTAAEMLRRTLTPLGHEIWLAADGEEAARRCHGEDRPDLIITDVLMPRMNGFALCRTLRAAPETRAIPIISVTSMDKESDRYWGLKQGADEYLVKPVDSAVLMRKVRSYLPPQAAT